MQVYSHNIYFFRMSDMVMKKDGNIWTRKAGGLVRNATIFNNVADEMRKDDKWSSNDFIF